MRHVQVKVVAGCSRVKTAQQLEKNHHRHAGRSVTDAQAAVSRLIEFPALQHKPPHHSLLHIVIRRERMASEGFNGQKS
jgi:hypothetical protein